METICRLCAEQSTCLSSVFSQYDGRLLADLITIVCPIQIDPRDDLPKSICEQCLEITVSANILRETSVKCDLNFRQGNISFAVKIEEMQRELPTILIKNERHEDPCDDPLAAIVTTFQSPKLEEEELQEELNNEFAVNEYEELESARQEMGKFPCPYSCGQMIAHENNISRHIKRRHKNEIQRSYKCDLCALELQSRNRILLHMNSHHLKISRLHRRDGILEHFEQTENNDRCSTQGSSRGYPCDICQRVFTFQYNMKRHKKRLHSPSLPFACHLCPDRFINSRFLEKHIETHLEPPKIRPRLVSFDCKFCGKNFKGSKQKLGKHLLRKHQNELSTVLECEFCQKKFASAYSHRVHLARHKDKIRIQNYAHGCDQCGKKFSTDFRLQKHIQSHSSDSAHICHICNQSMSNSSALEYHIRRHQGKCRESHPFICSYCNVSFKNEQALKAHVTKVHERNLPKKFNCDFCDKTFFSQFALTRHVMIHTGEMGLKTE